MFDLPKRERRLTEIRKIKQTFEKVQIGYKYLAAFHWSYDELEDVWRKKKK